MENDTLENSMWFSTIINIERLVMICTKSRNTDIDTALQHWYTIFIYHFLGSDDIIMQMTKNRTFAFVHESKVKGLDIKVEVAQQM